MADVTWKVSHVRGVERDEVARLVVLTAHHESDEFEGHGITYECDVFVPAGLTDLAAIEREAYARLRRSLPRLVAALPADPS